MKISLGKKEIIHFVGIGGIGMSGLALIMKDLGFNVKGSDQQNGKNIGRLKRNKINVQIGHKKKKFIKLNNTRYFFSYKKKKSRIFRGQEKENTNL